MGAAIQKTGKPPAEVWSEALPVIRRAGYHRIELIASSLQPPLRDMTLALLKKHDLLLNDMYNGVSVYEPEGARESIRETLEVADIAHSTGTRILLADLNAKPNRERRVRRELENEAKFLNEFGKQLQSRGMDLYLHNHDDPMRDGAREWRYVLHNTDPKLVSYCLDMDWAWNGGEDPFRCSMSVAAGCACCTCARSATRSGPKRSKTTAISTGAKSPRISRRLTSTATSSSNGAPAQHQGDAQRRGKHPHQSALGGEGVQSYPGSGLNPSRHLLGLRMEGEISPVHPRPRFVALT